MPRWTLNIMVLISLSFFCECRKDSGKIIIPDIPSIPEETFNCEDTFFDRNKYEVSQFAEVQGPSKASGTVSRVLYDVQDENVIYYLTGGGTESRYLYRYDRKTKSRTLLDKRVLYNISVNNNGWLAYDKIDGNIYKIKTNGDSLKQMTYDGASLWPRWTEDNKYIYYVSSGKNKFPIYKMDVTGKNIDSLKEVYSYVWPVRNFLYYLKLADSTFYLIQKDLNSGQEKTIVTRKFGQPESIADFYTDKNNTILYWWGDYGLFKTDLLTLETKLVIYGGANTANQILHYRQSPFTGRFIAIQFNTTYINYNLLKQSNRILEFTADGTCMRTLEIPD